MTRVGSQRHRKKKKFQSGRLEATHLYSDGDSRLAEETKHRSCPCHLTHKRDPPATCDRFFSDPKLANELYNT